MKKLIFLFVIALFVAVNSTAQINRYQNLYINNLFPNSRSILANINAFMDTAIFNGNVRITGSLLVNKIDTVRSGSSTFTGPVNITGDRFQAMPTGALTPMINATSAGLLLSDGDSANSITILDSITIHGNTHVTGTMGVAGDLSADKITTPGTMLTDTLRVKGDTGDYIPYIAEIYRNYFFIGRATHPDAIWGKSGSFGSAITGDSSFVKITSKDYSVNDSTLGASTLVMTPYSFGLSFINIDTSEYNSQKTIYHNVGGAVLSSTDAVLIEAYDADTNATTKNSRVSVAPGKINFSSDTTEVKGYLHGENAAFDTLKYNVLSPAPSASYKVYTAIISKADSTVTVTVLENTLGATIAWRDDGDGYVIGTASSSIFSASTAFMFLEIANDMSYNTNGQPYAMIQRGSGTDININTWFIKDSVKTYADGILDDSYIEIRVY